MSTFTWCLQAGQPFPVVNAATATGTGTPTVYFTVQQRAGDFGPRTVTFTPSSDGTITTATADLEHSVAGVDGPWVVYPNGAGLVFSGLAAVQVSNLVPGAIYRLNIKSLSLGTGTKISITASEG